MTRILSELLGAREPAFQQGLQKLERASGGAAQDIRLTADIVHGLHDKMRQLSLDPQDTTGRELYAALIHRIREDNAVFQELIGLRADAVDSPNLSATIQRFLGSLDMPKSVFALKSSSLKRLLRKAPPKRAMKQLGYRSVESMLKHEPVTLIMTAAHLVENAAWHKTLQAAYKKLTPGDFECRQLQILAPANSRWDALAKPYVMHAKHNIIGLRELGAVVLLPLPKLQLDAAALAGTLLALQAANEIAAASSYLKMNQVRSDFGELVAGVARNEPLTKAELAGSALPWKVVHRYFARHPEAYNPHLFEPHVHQEDLRWQSAEDLLEQLHPRFAFWQGTSHLGLLARPHSSAKHGEAVSLNLLDSVLNLCNRLPYEQRLLRYFRDHIWNELMLRYMRQGSIERTVHEQLSEVAPGL